jgi:hypothetical protein
VGHPAHALGQPKRTRFRHRPESTVLYQRVAEHWPAFVERAVDVAQLGAARAERIGLGARPQRL